MTYQERQANTMHPGANAVLELQYWFQGVLLGWLAVRAGRNSYAIHADFMQATAHGAEALRRWWIWLFFVKIWILSTLFVWLLTYFTMHDAANPQDAYVVTSQNPQLHAYLTNGHVFVPLSLALLLVAYCRNVDFSLFKRRLLYKVVLPLNWLLQWVPVWVFYVVALWVPVFGWIRW